MHLVAQVDVTFYVSGGFICLMGLRALYILPRIWREEIVFSVEAPPWWIWGQSWWSGWTRSMPSVVVFSMPGAMVILGCAIAADFLGLDQMIARLVAGVGGFLCLFGVLLGCSVMFFNQPAALVAPGRRDEMGVATAWFAEVKMRRAKRKTDDGD